VTTHAIHTTVSDDGWIAACSCAGWMSKPRRKVIDAMADAMKHVGRARWLERER
jgi:hypothetical protein